MTPDPYRMLGVSPGASDDELRHAYRQLVLRHHPDHNNGSPESARRFEEIQEAYARVLKLRAKVPPPPPPRGPQVDPRLEDLEREVREAQRAREAARAAARAAAAGVTGSPGERPSDEELGYVKTDDSFVDILADALDELGRRLKRQGP